MSTQKSKLFIFAKWCYNLPTIQPYCEDWIASLVEGDRKNHLYKHYLDKWLDLLHRSQSAEQAFLAFVCAVGDPEMERLEKWIVENFKA